MPIYARTSFPLGKPSRLLNAKEPNESVRRGGLSYDTKNTRCLRRDKLSSSVIVCASRQLTTLLSSKIRAANGASKIMTRNRQVMVVVDQKFPTLHRSPADYYLITVCPSFRLLVKDSRKPSPPARQCKKYPKACSSSSVASIETLGNADRIDREDGGRISSIGWSNAHFPGSPYHHDGKVIRLKLLV